MKIGNAFSHAKIRFIPIVMGHWLNLSYQASSRTSNKHFLRQDYENPSLSENHWLAGAERGLLRT
jgi:hypothetical protein